jgi:hypothetical protein
MQSLLNGPILLTGAACSLYVFLKLKENLEFGKIKSGGTHLSTSINNLSLKRGKQDREDASRHIYEFLKNSTKEEEEENRDIVYDHGGLKLLTTQIIAHPEQQTERALEYAMMSIQLLIRGSSEKRHAFNSYNGVHHLFQLSINNIGHIQNIALEALRTATRFDTNKRELEGDIPYGSEGALTLSKESKQDLRKLLNILEEEGDNKKTEAALGAIAHMSQTVKGSEVLNELLAVDTLIPFLSYTDTKLKKNALIAIGNSAKQNIAANIGILGEEYQLRGILSMLTRDPKLNPKIKRAVVDTLYQVALYRYRSGDKRKTEEFARLLKEKLQEGTAIIFYMGFASSDFRLKRAILDLEKLLINPDFSSEHETFSENLKSMEARIEVQRRQEKQKEQQMMSQLMGGMGGISLQELAMMQQMYA